MREPKPAPEDDREKDWFPNHGTALPSEDPQMPKPGMPENREKQNETGKKNLTKDAEKYLGYLQGLSD